MSECILAGPNRSQHVSEATKISKISPRIRPTTPRPPTFRLSHLLRYHRRICRASDNRPNTLYPLSPLAREPRAAASEAWITQGTKILSKSFVLNASTLPGSPRPQPTDWLPSKAQTALAGARSKQPVRETKDQYKNQGGGEDIELR